MKYLLIISFIFLTVIGLSSCEENFSPRSDYQERYILNCIIRADTTLQVATAEYSYNVAGHNPYINKENQFASNVLIRMWQGDEGYRFRDTLVESTDAIKYSGNVHVYCLKNFKPSENDSLAIEAIFPNGRTLSASATIPSKIEWDPLNSSGAIPPEDGSTYKFAWKNINPQNWYLARFVVNYKNFEEGMDVVHSKVIPLKYVFENGRAIPKFSEPSRNNGITFNKAALDSAFRQISGDDPAKGNYFIYKGELQLLIFGESLSKYYSNLFGFLDDFTVRIDQNDYSNVEGGYGVFGAYLKQTRTVRFKDEYIKSFGYGVGQ